ncbi:Autophagy-related protein 27 [Vigna unguiculata]|uniref:Autophagy-related protein 27 n=1 Tax=Vigna unguiculata TaxID=3917 RepID=A0A4D6MD71_VIGUN|nr:Autophagy-related protein 27 [Vigna unguiculata]
MVNGDDRSFGVSAVGGTANRGIVRGRNVDKKNPHTGVIFKMSNSGPKFNCSLAVSVICNSNGVQGPQSLERLGACDYVTELKHPSGCAVIINVHGGGLGWFGTLMIIVLCLFAAYLLAGIVYRFFFLGIRGVDIIPNLDFWISLPRRTQKINVKFTLPSLYRDI